MKSTDFCFFIFIVFAISACTNEDQSIDGNGSIENYEFSTVNEFRKLEVEDAFTALSYHFCKIDKHSDENWKYRESHGINNLSPDFLNEGKKLDYEKDIMNEVIKLKLDINGLTNEEREKLYLNAIDKLKNCIGAEVSYFTPFKYFKIK